MMMHSWQYRGRSIRIETALGDDGKYFVKEIRAEVRKAGAVVLDDMPYQSIRDADEATVVQKATFDASVYVQNRL